MITHRRWESGGTPVEMLESMWQQVTNRGRHPERDRKVRLYYAGLARQYWDELPWIARVTTELAERKADGKFDESVLRRPLGYIAEGVLYAAQHGDPDFMWGVSDYEKYLLEIGIEKPVDAPEWNTNGDSTRTFNLAILIGLVTCGGFPAHEHTIVGNLHSLLLLRDIFGNPFRPVALADSWHSESAVVLARAMYESRDFSPMPVLADALEEAGCDNAEVLSHCRQSDGVHVRGCWVADGVLGKA